MDAASRGTHTTTGAGSGGRLSVTVAAIVALGRLLYSIERTTFHLSPDELANAGMARFLSGTGSWNMFDASTWRPGYALLIAPAFWLTENPVALVRIALAANAVLAGVTSVYLFKFAVRCTDLGPRGAAVWVTIASLLPAQLSASAFVWAEPLVALSFSACVWHTMRAFDRSAWNGVAAIGCAVVGYTAHGRLLPVLLLVTAAVVVASFGSGHRAQAAGLAALGIGGWLASNSVANYVFDQLWEDQYTTNTAGSVLRRLSDPGAVLEAAAGQVWYLLVTSVMLVGVGAGVAITRLLRSSTPHDRRLEAAVLLGLTLPMLATSAIFISGRQRPDFLVYGRYNDAIISPVLLLGIGWVASRSRRVARPIWFGTVGTAVAVSLLLGSYVELRNGSYMSDAQPVMAMIAGLQPLTGPGWTVEPMEFTLIAIVVGLILFGTVRWASDQLSATLIAVAVAIGAGVLTRHAYSDRINRAEVVAAVHEESSVLLAPYEDIYVGFIPSQFDPAVAPADQVAQAFLYQWYLPGHRFLRLTGDSSEAGAAAFSPANDGQLLTRGAVPLWVDPTTPMVLWRIPRSAP